MAEPHIIVIAEFTLNPESMDQAKAMVLKLIAPSRSDPGCWYYDFFQDQTKENTFILLEHWSNKAAWDLHFQKDYVQKFVSEITSYLQQPPQIRWFMPVD